MKIILKKDHDLLGDEGQVIDVKSGYARNFLIPNGIATIANISNLKTYEEITKQRAKKVQKQIEESQKIANELAKHEITIEVKAGEDDKIFGSVTSQMIYDRLIEKGFDSIDRKKIILKEPIKSLGDHELEIKIQKSILAKIIVKVVKEKAASEIEEETVQTSEETEKPAEQPAV